MKLTKKKIAFIILIVFILSVLLSACSSRIDDIGQPAYYESYYVPTYEELWEFIGRGGTYSFRVTDSYRPAVERMISSGIPIPCRNGTPIPLDDRPDYSGITVMPDGFGGVPNIIYRTGTEGAFLYVRVMLEWDKVSAYTDQDSGSEILRAVNPDAPNLHNAKDMKQSWSAIDETTLITSTGEKTALRFFSATDEREYLTFMQNGFLVTLFADKDHITADWLKDFQIDLMSVTGS